MAKKGKIRELQEDLKISRQTVRGLSEYCEKYKKRIKELEELVKNSTIPVVVCSAFAKEMYSKINESTRDHKNKNAQQIYKDDALEMVEETVALINGKYK